MRKILLTTALALCIGLGGVAVAAEPHSHTGAVGGDATHELQLNHGRRWVTDTVLREGMARIRDAMEAALPRIHAGGMPPAEYEVLADRVRVQVDYMVENCRIPEEADRQLHLVLAQLLDGVEMMKGHDEDRAAGAATIVRALGAYGRVFDHPGWIPLEH